MGVEILAILLISSTIVTGVGAGFWYYFKALEKAREKITDQRVLEIARNNGGEINTIVLCEQGGLTLNEAGLIMQHLQGSGALHYRWDSKNLTLRYVLKESQQIDSNHLLTTDQQKGFALSTTNTLDADIIHLAAKNGGLITVAAVSAALHLSVDIAKQKLEELRQKDIFVVDVSQSRGMVYRLIDEELANTK